MKLFLMKIFSNSAFKRYFWSSFVTFMSAFLLSLGMTFKELDIDSLNWAVLLGTMVTASRVAVKVLFEFLVSKVK